MELRAIKKEDVPAVAKLVGEVANYHHKIDPIYKAAKHYDNLEEMVGGWLADPDTLVLVVEENKKLLAYTRIGVESAPEYSNEKKIGVIYDAFVEEESRRQGIAALLFGRSLEWFGKKKVDFLELSVDARNAGAVDFWRELGFEDYKMRMRRPLDR